MRLWAALSLACGIGAGLQLSGVSVPHAVDWAILALDVLVIIGGTWNFWLGYKSRKKYRKALRSEDEAMRTRAHP